MSLLISLAGSALAKENNDVNPQVLRSFKSEFLNAENVRWNKIDGVYAANFIQNGFRIEAYFDETGDLIGSVRNVLFTDLPLAVVHGINKKYGNAPIYELFEYTIDKETYYKMRVELQDKTVRVRCGIAGDLTVEKKISQ